MSTLAARKPLVVSLVLNGVQGDSRVLKTAQAAINAGYDALVIGVGKADVVEETVIEGVRVRLNPNHANKLRKLALWTPGPEKRDIGLLVSSYLTTLLPQIVELRPDVIHSHDMNCLKLGALSRKVLQAAGHKAGWVHDLHEFVPGLRGEIAEAYKPTCLEWERTYLHTADRLITVSESLAAHVAARYNLPEAPVVLHNTPYRGSFSDRGPDVRTAIGVSPGTPLGVFVGGASALRGCDTITRAIGRLPGVHIAFVSRGSYVQTLRDLAATLSIEDRFHVHDQVPSDRVTSFIRTADVGINGLVHYPNGEVALPNKLFEYLHAGLPVVSSDVEAMSGFVTSHNVGTVFTAGDDVSCAAAIRAALDNRAVYRSNISGSLIDTYSWENHERKLQAIYSALLRAPRTISAADRQSAIDTLASERGAFTQQMALALLGNLSDDLGRQQKAVATQNKAITDLASRVETAMQQGQGLEALSTPKRARKKLKARLNALVVRVKRDGTVGTLKHIGRTRLSRRKTTR